MKIFWVGLIILTPTAAIAQTQLQEDQAAANQMAADDAKIRLECERLKKHPIEYAIEAALKNHSVAYIKSACARLPALEEQAAQLEAQEGIVPDASQAAIK